MSKFFGFLYDWTVTMRLIGNYGTAAAFSVLRILLPRRNSGDVAMRLATRALIRRWLGELRGVRA
jgi:hypothetical protein